MLVSLEFRIGDVAYPPPVRCRITIQVKRYYDLIPPYLAHRDDWKNLLPEWVIQAPKVTLGIC